MDREVQKGWEEQVRRQGSRGAAHKGLGLYAPAPEGRREVGLFGERRAGAAGASAGPRASTWFSSVKSEAGASTDATAALCFHVLKCRLSGDLETNCNPSRSQANEGKLTQPSYCAPNSKVEHAAARGRLTQLRQGPRVGSVTWKEGMKALGRPSI